MRFRPAFYAVPIGVAAACWFGALAQQPEVPVAHDTVDPVQVSTLAGRISARSERLKPVFDQVHPSEWVAKGAPEAYVSQWASLVQQNQAIIVDMTGVGQRADAESVQSPQYTVQNESLEQTLTALFRVHRFDSDLAGLLGPVRRYQDAALADQIEGMAAGDQRDVEQMQNYAIDLAAGKDQQLSVEDREAQRCRTMLAQQPVAHPAPSAPAKARKTTSGATPQK